MRVQIFDTTLRDGEQTPRVSLSPDQKLQIAKKLDDLGVDAIESGFPIISDGEKKAIKMICDEGLDAKIYGLARATQKDIDAIIDAGLNYIHLFIATSDIHLEYKLKMTRDEVTSHAITSIEYAKSHGLQVEFSAEDATRTDRTFLKEFFGKIAEAGADTIDIPDTVGYSTPQYIAKITKDAIDLTNLPVSIHCHNDFGLAVANAISAIQAGAKCAHVTINGIGERAGNTSLEEFVMALQCLEFDEKYTTGIETTKLYDTSRFVSKLVGINVPPNKAIVGDNAFGHESGIHTHGILNNPLTYEPINPEIVGHKRWMQVGKHAGLHGMNMMLTEYDIHPNKEQSRQILEKIKSIADGGKQITDVELLSISDEILQDNKTKQMVYLNGFSVSTGIGTMPYAFVKLNIDGKDFSATDYGVGPVDASLNAIQKIIGKIVKIRIKDYELESISGGSNALCEVTIRVEDEHSNTVSAKYVGEDIVTTGVKAVISGINRIMLKTMLK